MPSVSQLELEHCKELALIPGSLFEFTSRFITAPRQHQLLALYALTRSVNSIPISSVDDAVKWTKLKWWSEELLADPASPSRHPVVRALWQSGARSRLEDGLLVRLINDAIRRIDAAPDASEDAMFKRLALQGETGILLESALDGAEISGQELANRATASELFSLVSSQLSSGHRRDLHLPLDLLARYQINATRLAQEPPPKEWLSVISHLADKGIQWFKQASPGLESSMVDCRHLKLRWAMEARQLARISRRTRQLLRTGIRYGPTDAWFAWRFCRRFKT